MTANENNNLWCTNSNRRQRQTEKDNTHSVFNLVNVATAMETSTSDKDTNNPPSGGAASVIFTSYSILFALMLLVMFMF